MTSGVLDGAHPRLTAGTTTLRRFETSDAAAFAAIHRDRENVRWTGSVPDMDAEAAAAYIDGNLAAGWDSGKQLRLAVAEHLGGADTVVGTVSLQEVFSTRPGGSAAVGIKMLPQGRGTGSAARAVELLCRWAFDGLGLEYLHWHSAATNYPGLALARRCGFVAGAPIAGWGHEAGRVVDGVILSLDAAQWAARNGQAAGPAVPELRADTVVLRALTMADAPALIGFCRDPESVRWTTVPLDYTLAHAQAFIGHLVPEGWRTGKVLTFAVADPASNALLATVDLQCRIPKAAAVGINVGPTARGTGIAEAAVRVLLEYAFGELGLDFVHWHAMVPNWGSRKLAWKLGFAFDGELRGSHNDRGTPRGQWVLSLAAGEPRTPQLPWTGPAPATR
ncbi:GNAT family N-acetyltransferase [Specibacter sp. NPDC057265]|uniref:GNAT family N-acetyltransferase n=1 Tax=Specibacter sp. NPDC057265 TaxID=3346075 RepID=UPI0036396F7C